MNMPVLEKKLRKADKKQAVLYLFCNFLSLMLITAYSAMMFSPTVQNILPEGGDSRKQMYMIFVLALSGCLVFTVYASTLFFRKKSRQLGILMALGASRKRLAPGLFREVLLLSCASSVLGILAGIPVVLLLWSFFRIFLVNTAEMVFTLNFQCLYISAGMFLAATSSVCVLAFLYLRKTNIIDVVQEEHKNEPVKELGKWCGPVGILVMMAGAVLGYYHPQIYEARFNKYAPGWANAAYLPVFAGLYMVMLHTVVHGWSSRRKHPYRNIIARSMMKFQGKQTVNSLIVCTVLIAGGCFAVFYLPILSVSSLEEAKARPYDYGFHYRADQELPGKDEIAGKAGEYGISIKDWTEASYISLAVDGRYETLAEDGTIVHEYREMNAEAKILSETAYNTVTGQNADVPRGCFSPISNDEETGTYRVSSSDSVFTNPETRRKLPLKFNGFLHFGMLTDQIGYYVLDDADYKELARGITPCWSGNLVYFNADGKDSYAFADDLYHMLSGAYDRDCLVSVYYNRIKTALMREQGLTEEAARELESNDMSALDPDATDFRLYWAYMPKFRILDTSDFMETFAVFLMTFLFISIICLTAALVIAYTRCQTIAVNNRYVFDDLKRLGGSPGYLKKELRRQCTDVFRIPAASGMGAMSFLYLMILFANDGRLTMSEILGFLICMGIIAAVGALFYGIYTHTLRIISLQLEIDRK